MNRMDNSVERVGVREVARIWNVPYSTLRRRVMGDASQCNGKHQLGRPTVLSKTVANANVENLFQAIMPIPKRIRAVAKRPRIKPPSYELPSASTMAFVSERVAKSYKHPSKAINKKKKNSTNMPRDALSVEVVQKKSTRTRALKAKKQIVDNNRPVPKTSEQSVSDKSSKRNLGKVTSHTHCNSTLMRNKSTLPITTENEAICPQCQYKFDDPGDPKYDEEWIKCTRCATWSHNSCSEENGVLDDDDFLCGSCVP